MIFRTQKLEELKDLQYQPLNLQIKQLKQKVLKEVWPQTNNNNFCEAIESIALKWLNQFVTLIEKWLTQTSSKYITQLSQSNKIKNPQQKNQIYQYVLNLSKYIQSMQHPLITSINNIHSLYLQFPSDQLIQQPKKSLYNQYQSLESSPIKKKKSLSIQSFTSNLPTRSRSTSKNRKLSFFKNSIKPNIFQTFCKESKKTNQNLNTTVKKVKKDLPFTKTATASTFHSYPNQHNQKQNNKSAHSQVTDLKQKLEKRLSNTCSSTFFNQVVLQQPFSREQFFVNDHVQTEVGQKVQKQMKSSFSQQDERKELQQDLKKSILQELDRKQKSNYEHLLKDIENKLSTKFDALLTGILREKQSTDKKQKPSDRKETVQNFTKQTNSEQALEKPLIKAVHKEQNPPNKQNTNLRTLPVNKQETLTSNQIPDIIIRQPSICNMVKNNKETTLPLYEASQIEELKPVQIKKESKLNTSVIVQKDSSQLIKSKSKNYSVIKDIKSNKHDFAHKKIIQKKTPKSYEKPINYNHPLDHNSSIDSIQILDTPMNSSLYPKPNHFQNSTLSQPQNAKPTISQNKKTESSVKNEDNFYMKRIKQLKNKMENSIKNYKLASDKLILPVNQTFMLIFSTSYQQFCLSNSLPFNSPQVNETLSKYNSKSQINSKKPESDEKFLMDSLIKIQKMVNLKCPPEKKIKIHQYTEKCIECIENVFFKKPDLKLNSEADLTKKLKEIKGCLANSINQ